MNKLPDCLTWTAQDMKSICEDNDLYVGRTDGDARELLDRFFHEQQWPIMQFIQGEMEAWVRDLPDPYDISEQADREYESKNDK